LTISRQIEAVLTNDGRAAPPNRQDLVALRCQRLSRIFADMGRAGHPLSNVVDLEASHGRAVLQYWCDIGKAAATIRSEWSVLRTFAKCVGKSVLDGPIQRFSNALPKMSYPPKAPASALPPRHQDLGTVALLEASRDRTHYFIERLCQLLRISVQQALTLDPGDLTALLACPPAPGLATNKRMAAAIAAHPAELEDACAQLCEFLAGRDRPTLVWEGHGLVQSMRKHENHLAYIRRRSKCEREAPPHE
jgi:hypothetical protein